jgi:hypothetical protein
MTPAKEFINVFPDIVHIVRPQVEVGNLAQYINAMITWAEERNFHIFLTNTWDEGTDTHICFRVVDETQRFWFALKWK